MAVSLLVDTDVLIDFFRGVPPAACFFQKQSQEIAFSTITIAEIYAGIRSATEQAIIERTMALFPIFPVAPDIARKAGALKRAFGSSHGVGLADAVIAATAQHQGLSLVTLNVNHFPMFKGLKPAYKKP